MNQREKVMKFFFAIGEQCWKAQIRMSNPLKILLQSNEKYSESENWIFTIKLIEFHLQKLQNRFQFYRRFMRIRLSIHVIASYIGIHTATCCRTAFLWCFLQLDFYVIGRSLPIMSR